MFLSISILVSNVCKFNVGIISTRPKTYLANKKKRILHLTCSQKMKPLQLKINVLKSTLLPSTFTLVARSFCETFLPSEDLHTIRGLVVQLSLAF